MFFLLLDFKFFGFFRFDFVGVILELLLLFLFSFFLEVVEVGEFILSCEM